MRAKNRYLKFLAAVLLLAGVQAAQAANTTQGTPISNSASVDYTVGGINQPDVNSNTVTFLVDRRINVTVAESGGAYTDVTPGSTAQVLTFTVTNSTNGTQDFRLITTNDTTGATDPFGVNTDDFDPTGIQVFVDSNANDTYDAGVDTATFIDEMPKDTTLTVFVVADIPLGLANDNTAGITLTAVAADAGYVGSVGTLGPDATQTTGAETPGSVDTVFGDVAGDTDAARDGRHSDDDAYRVRTATITVTKTSKVVSDPFNGTTNPKAIPGAVIEYCLQVANAAGGTAATNVVVSDPVPANTTFVTGSIVAGGTVSSGVCNADGTSEDDNSTGGDESDPNGGSITGSTVASVVPALAAGATTTTRFRVTID
jgi:uncharacterized repeat protein (TIGR01451 family)